MAVSHLTKIAASCSRWTASVSASVVGSNDMVADVAVGKPELQGKTDERCCVVSITLCYVRPYASGKSVGLDESVV
jgi:hypothetical protein